MDSVTVLLRARDHEKRSYRVIQKTANEAGTITIFTPFVLSDSGATDLAELMARSITEKISSTWTACSP